MSSVESLYDQLLERMREEQDKYLEEFKTPESFIDLRGKILVDPMTVYSKSAQHAREHGEVDAYRLSMQANRACKEEIERAIGEHYNANKLDSRSAVKEVLERFGAEPAGRSRGDRQCLGEESA